MFVYKKKQLFERIAAFFCGLKVSALGEVANFGTDYFMLIINFLRKINVNFALFSQ